MYIIIVFLILSLLIFLPIQLDSLVRPVIGRSTKVDLIESATGFFIGIGPGEWPVSQSNRLA